MAENQQIRCPQCATLYPAQEACCPHCGVAAGTAARQEYIEKLLQNTGEEEREKGKAPILTDPASLAFDGARSTPVPGASAAAPAGVASAVYTAGAPTLQVKWESVPIGEATKVHEQSQPAFSRFLRKHKKPILIAGAAVLLVFVLVLVFLGVRNARLGYRVSPERLVAGIQRALDNKDIDAFFELSLPRNFDLEEYMAGAQLPASALPDIRLEIVDVLTGKNNRYALVVVRAIPHDQNAENGEAVRTMLPMVKQDGRWYCDSSSGYDLAYNLSRYITHSYEGG